MIKEQLLAYEKQLMLAYSSKCPTGISMQKMVRVHVDVPIHIYEFIQEEAESRNITLEKLMQEIFSSLAERLRKGEINLEQFKN